MAFRIAELALQCGSLVHAPGVQPPIVLQYNASSVPVLQRTLSSDRLNEQRAMR